MKRIIISGNCQANELKSILMRADVSGGISVKWRKTFENEFFPGDMLIDDDYRLCDLYLQQIGTWDDEDSRTSLLPKKCERVRFPALSLDAVWPLGFRDPRNEQSPVKGHEPYPYGAADRLAYSLKNKGLDEDSIVEQYLSTKVQDVVDIDRLTNVLHEKAALLETRVTPGLEMQGYVDGKFREKRLFLTRNHPTGILMAELLRRLVANSVVGEWVKNADFLIEVTERSAGIGDYEDPINPQIVKHFGLSWAGLDYKYAYHHEGRFDFIEGLRRYIRFQFNHNILLLRREMGAGRLNQNTFLTAIKATTYDPSNWYVHLNIAELHKKMGDNYSALESLKLATKLEPTSWAPSHTMAGILLAEGRIEEALVAQHHAVAGAPDKGATHYLLGLIQERMGDRDSARQSYARSYKLEPNRAHIKSAAARMGMVA